MTLSTLSLIGIIGGLLFMCSMMCCFCDTSGFINRHQVNPEEIVIVSPRVRSNKGGLQIITIH